MLLYRRQLEPLDLSFFFFNDTATTEIYTLSLHDALPICQRMVELLKQGQYQPLPAEKQVVIIYAGTQGLLDDVDRKSTRLNSSHLVISYAVFCLKKKKKRKKHHASFHHIAAATTESRDTL